MNRWQHFIWVGAIAVLAGGWTTPAHAQNRQAGARTSNQQGGGMCQQGNTGSQGTGVNAATSARASGTQNSSGMQSPFNQANGFQNPYQQGYGNQQMNQAQMAMMMQLYMAQMSALQQQMGQATNNQNAALNAFLQQRATQNTNAPSTRRTAAR